MSITGGTLPRKPVLEGDEKGQKLIDESWSLMQECWKFKDTERPDISYVVQKLT